MHCAVHQKLASYFVLVHSRLAIQSHSCPNDEVSFFDSFHITSFQKDEVGSTNYVLLSHYIMHRASALEPTVNSCSFFLQTKISYRGSEEFMPDKPLTNTNNVFIQNN